MIGQRFFFILTYHIICLSILPSVLYADIFLCDFVTGANLAITGARYDIKSETMTNPVFSEATIILPNKILHKKRKTDVRNAYVQIVTSNGSIDLGVHLRDIFQSNFLEKLRKVADDMTVFPVDLIARKGPLCFYPCGISYGIIEHREELSLCAWKRFYDFCYLALHASDEDIESCISNLPVEPPKVQALILTTIYIHAYPWSDVMARKNWNVDVASREWSWLAINIVCFHFDFKKRLEAGSEKRLKYKKIISQYISDDSVAFKSVDIANDYIDTGLVFSKYYQDYYWSGNRNGILKHDCTYIGTRMRFCEQLKEQYPNDYHSMISDMLYVNLEKDLFFGFASRGVAPRFGNASSTPKTIGQIATQLSESWDPPPPLPDDELMVQP